MTNPKHNQDKPNSPGPKPDHLKIDADWEDAVDDALAKKKPAKGWPKSGDDQDPPQTDADGD